MINAWKIRCNKSDNGVTSQLSIKIINFKSGSIDFEINLYKMSHLERIY